MHVDEDRVFSNSSDFIRYEHSFGAVGRAFGREVVLRGFAQQRKVAQATHADTRRNRIFPSFLVAGFITFAEPFIGLAVFPDCQSNVCCGHL